jgi:hypothetical protein
MENPKLILEYVVKFLTRCQDHSTGKRILFLTNSAGKTGYSPPKNEPGCLPNTIVKN